MGDPRPGGSSLEGIASGAVTWDRIWEIGELVCGKVPRRGDNREITILKNNGLSVQFAGVGAAVMKRAKDAGLAHPEQRTRRLRRRKQLLELRPHALGARQAKPLRQDPMRSTSGGTMASIRSSGSGRQPSAASVSTSGWTRSMPHRSVSGSTLERMPDCRIQSSERAGSGAESNFLISDHTRSADSLSSPSLSLAQAFRPAASGRPLPYQAKKRKKRRMRR